MGAHKEIMIARQGEEAMKAYAERFADDAELTEAREKQGSWQTTWWCETCGSSAVLVAHWIEPTTRKILDPVEADVCLMLYDRLRGWCDTCNDEAQVEPTHWWKKNEATDAS